MYYAVAFCFACGGGFGDVAPLPARPLTTRQAGLLRSLKALFIHKGGGVA